MRRPLLKVCGMRDAENIAALVAQKPDYIGFIFYPPSRRFVGDALDPAQLLALPASICKVGVFVNEPIPSLLSLCQRYHLDAAQLHGDESPAYCEELHVQAPHLSLFKAFGVDADFAWDSLEAYLPYISLFVFDTKSPQYGGTGLSFDWSALSQYAHKTPFLLSGGLGEHNLDEALTLFSRIPTMRGFDLNSKVERAPARKDIDAVARIQQRLQAFSPS